MRNRFSFLNKKIILIAILFFLISANQVFAAYTYSKPALVEDSGTFSRITIYIKSTTNQSVRVVFDAGGIAGFCDGGVVNPYYGVNNTTSVFCASALKNKSYKVFLTKPGTMEKIQDLPSVSTTPKTPTNNTPPVVKTELQKAQEAYNKAKAEYDKNPTAQNSANLNNATKNLDDAKKNAGVKTIENEVVNLPTNEQVKPSDNTTYNLLAPLPGLKSIETNDIGKYFNILFNIAIGICGVLAVIMLIIHGISYMTSESFTEKAELKKKIWGPIGGLLLALGAYAILNTIDPALTGSEGLSVDQVSAEIDGDPILSNEKTIIPSTGVKTSKCPEGVEEVKTVTVRFIACKSISSKFKQMIADANSAGLKISGGGFRTPAEQIATRKANCGAGNEFNKNAKCNPTTAYPGTSMHETGLAFDLKCNGSLINIGTGKKNRFPTVASTKVCFDWLSQNGGKYGLRNLPIENWHWSTNGH